jgi:hypothetical protein
LMQSISIASSLGILPERKMLKTASVLNEGCQR